MPAFYVIATPIGHLEDVTFRAVRVLREVGALACEDTRHTRILLERYEIPKPPILFACHEHNEAQAVERILGLLRDGVSVGLCTNAGYPGISDPGYPAISRALAAGFEVQVIPGAGAVETALVSSGLPTSSYTFKGFPPRKSGQLHTMLARYRDVPETLIFFESPHRIAKFLASAELALGDRRAAVCVELTKKFESIHRGYLSELAVVFGNGRTKGEITVVIAGNHPKFTRAPATVADAATADAASSS